MTETKNYYKVAIDLATKKIGVVILDQDNKLKWHEQWELYKWDDDVLMRNIGLIDDYVKSLTINQPFVLGIELSNFKNAQTTQRFSFYAGAFVTSFITNFKEYFQELKLFNSNAWQLMIGCKPNDERDLRKALARAYTYDNCYGYSDDWSEDECDAFCIAYNLEKIVSTTEQYNSNQKKRVAKGQKQAMIDKIQKMIITRLEKVNALDKVKNKKKIENLNNELQELKLEKAKLVEEAKAIWKQ